MEDQKLQLKVQTTDKTKRLPEKAYANLEDLKSSIEASFKNLRAGSYVLKYQDDENDWLYIFDDLDLQALKDYFREKGGKSVKLYVESHEDLAESTVKPVKFSQVKDSCVAEVEAYLQQHKEEDKQEPCLQVVQEDDNMDVEIVEEKPKQSQENVDEGIQLMDALKTQLEATKLVQEDASEDHQMNIEPVIVEENNVPEAKDVELEEETIETSRKAEESKEEPEPVPEQEPEEELKEFNIMDMLQNVQNTLNKDNGEFKPKDLFWACKDSVKGTKAEKNMNKVCRSIKNKKGPIFKRLIQGVLGNAFCQEPENKKSDVVHRGITCDGCNKDNISGVRYKCSECPDYDLCEDCEAKDVHNHHVFLKLKYPMGVDIIYSHRTEDDSEAARSSHPPHHPPHHAPPHHAPPHHPPHHHPHGPGRRGPWGGRGGRGGCHRNWENNPLMQMAKQFFGGMDFQEDEASSSPQRNNRKGGKWTPKRPVVTKKPANPIYGVTGGMQIVETTIQNQSPFPYVLKNVKMTESDEGLTFQEIETQVVLKKDESQDFCLAVQLPEKAGTYKASFGFFNKNGQQHGETLNVVFVVNEATE